ncbi:DUF5808 domain-containing protein [Mucilaginibacter agri]|uniref:DUF5808 domain-containing protein n=1 Tax=Mucilaginibacter agri TaxID=2695265 RepID=UPI0021D24F7F|nr:DUF5808 domain-containing protein [Mucilaginibacter agri]
MNQFDKQNPSLFKLGIFYFNKNDADLMVPKRSGLGWTVNFAHTRSWIFTGVIVAVILAAVIYLS